MPRISEMDVSVRIKFFILMRKHNCWRRKTELSRANSSSSREVAIRIISYIRSIFKIRSPGINISFKRNKLSILICISGIFLFWSMRFISWWFSPVYFPGTALALVFLSKLFLLSTYLGLFYPLDPSLPGINGSLVKLIVLAAN